MYEKNWPALVFVSSPDRANKLAKDAAEVIAVSDNGADFSVWLQENVGPGWFLANAVRYGYGVHHGRIPRAIASHMVRLFNEGDLPVLFCTSTLIEGVNTAAKSVLIYDKAISRSDYDFFTFSNIKGRAGRLGQHHVGKVFLFNAPPGEELMEVAPTLFGDEKDAPDDYVVHLDKFDSTKKTDERVDLLKKNLGLDSDGVKIAASIGLEKAAELRDRVDEGLREGRLLAWSHYPIYDHIKAVVEVICKVKRPNEFGCYSAAQLAFFISQLRSAVSMRQFLLEYDQRYQGQFAGHDNIFKFLRSCEYGLPQVFSVVELFVKRYYPDTDYSLFLHDISRWFRPEELKNLDEEGIPIQISERFIRPGDSKEALTNRLTQAAYDPKSGLSGFERRWVISALELESVENPVL